MGFLNKKKSKAKFKLELDEQRKTLHENLRVSAAEQYKKIRTNLDFALLGAEGCSVVGITSSVRGEGKSTTAINLSYVFAEKGSKVLLIDADLRLPSVAQKIKMDNSPGLSDLLRGNTTEFPPIQSRVLDNWFVLPAGEIPPNPSELLGSPRMEKILNGLKERFDYIFMDLPPVTVVSDALIVSPLITGAVVVVREEYTEKNELDWCFRQLYLAETKVLGCIMNDAKLGSEDAFKEKSRERRRFGKRD